MIADLASDLWRALPNAAQDLALTLALLAPAALLALLALRGQAPWPLARALLLRFRWTNLLFVALMALSVGLGGALLSQERALRQAAARVADPFDVIVAAPGDEIRVLLSTVYLQPAAALPLLGADALRAIQEDPRVSLAAPVAFGDSHEGAPIVGTTAAFVERLSGPFAEGRPWAEHDEAVVGAYAAVRLGDALEPAHGAGDGADAHAHEGHALHVVGRMAPTGGPWDRAILVPIEALWEMHGLAPGHAPERAELLGPPFDPAFFPGAPAFVLSGATLADAYAIRARHDRDGAMAFFPGATLARLHSVLGDVREAMSLMAILTQALAAAGVLAGLVALARLFARRFALLRAMGAPRRFVLGVVWLYAACLLGAGCLGGLALGWASAGLVSAAVSARTGMAVAASLGWPEVQLAAAAFTLASILALAPAVAAYRRAPVEDLRAG
ncbi:FtsX-like permease family protein [Albimonas sp. CAU 1670]|uniref:FtsX-like permease family protein n=1 Tax=Albimonas sp. CAU 1670 TaxID=3032599 RepID=UPI0023DBE7D8|nr:FtsX-like permease family protein [Albimonas sp. CAU 1670]MDF2232904.1 FtsX-like permease family protein [Albimonas sp. CAU 1670]